MRDDELEGWFTDWRPSFLESLIAAQKENLHSAALGWLLQAEELPLGGRVQLLEALGVPRIAETESISTRTEWDDIDVFVELEAAGRPLGIVAIENKLKASEHSEQLTRYDGLLANQQVHAKVFLTLTGEPAESGEGWRSASYSDLRRGLEGLKQACPEHRYLSDYCDVVSRAVAATRLVASVEAYSAFALKEDEPDASVSPGFVRYADHCGWGTVLGRIWMSAVGKLALQGVTLTRWHLRTSESRGDALLNLERVIERRGVRV